MPFYLFPTPVFSGSVDDQGPPKRTKHEHNEELLVLRSRVEKLEEEKEQLNRALKASTDKYKALVSGNEIVPKEQWKSMMDASTSLHTTLSQIVPKTFSQILEEVLREVEERRNQTLPGEE